MADKLVRTGNAYEHFDQGDYDLVPYPLYKVYLAGRMVGITKAEAQGWRRQLINELKDYPEFEFFDPTATLSKMGLKDNDIIEASYTDSEDGNPDTVFAVDMDAVTTSHFIVVAHHPSVSWGAAFEAGVAWYNGAETIHITSKEENDAIKNGTTPRHPLKVGTYVDNVSDAAKYLIARVGLQSRSSPARLIVTP